ncbi:MAG TPA: GNAT family N-acetyltransferase [Chthoniobacterales bacterium]|jgi:Acetyltransferase (GNAT) domain|nr:GNAT family N-acetyltransferase [Chthoniobacterales bacterium]
MEVDCKRILIEGEIPRIARLEQEWYEDVEDPRTLINQLCKSEPRPDILTFWQRLPDTEPKYSYPMELDSIAALPIKSYSLWWEKQIDRKARNKIRKAQKNGVVVKPATFDDRFVRGITSIFNETPIRQGRHYLHYGKDFETIKRQFSRFLFREEIFGAYLGEELVGFIMLAYAENYAYLGQIISKIAHRDLAPNNLLLAKAVERCAEKGVPYLVYALWLEDSLGDFKRSNGFQKFDLPRYYVPLTGKGKLALKLGLHRGWKEAVPKPLRKSLKKLRRRWYDLQCRLTNKCEAQAEGLSTPTD